MTVGDAAVFLDRSLFAHTVREDERNIPSTVEDSLGCSCEVPELVPVEWVPREVPLKDFSNSYPNGVENIRKERVAVHREVGSPADLH